MAGEYVNDYISKVNYKNILQLIDSGKDSGNSLIAQYHPICKCFRTTKDESYNVECENCDSQKVKEYYSSKSEQPQLYICHIGLWEMAFPVYIYGKLVGVLLSGQIILNGNIGDAVKKYENKYAISCPEQINHLNQQDYIVSQLKKYPFDKEFESIYGSFNCNRHDDRHYHDDEWRKSVKYIYDIEKLEEKYNDFLDFSIMFRELIESFYKNTIKLEERNLINALDNELSNKIPYTSQEGRWAFILKIVLDFCDTINISDFRIYVGQEDNFKEILSKRGIIPSQLQNTIDACLTRNFPKNTLLKYKYNDPDMKSCYKNLSESIKLDAGRFCFYMGDLKGPSDKSIITLLFIFSQDNIADGDELIHSFCQMMTLRIGISEALTQISWERDNFKDKVRRVSHHVKNSAQKALAGIHSVYDSLIVNEQQLLFKIYTIDNILRSIKNEMLELKESYAPFSHKFNMIFLIQDLINEFNSLAEEKECKILFEPKQEFIFVELNEMEIRIAISNLIENAIKYSYHAHEIDIALEYVSETFMKFEIRNFGIGIPIWQQKQIRLFGVRGNVKDKDNYSRERTGSGMGLPIAIEYIENLHNGKVNIVSYAADDGEREPFHRYVTKVEVILPIKLEK
jgi:signal transduction histidine kinase/ligand-binding sensor protein